EKDLGGTRRREFKARAGWRMATAGGCKTMRAALLPLRHRLDHLLDDTRYRHAGHGGLLLARTAAHIDAEDAEARREIGHEQARERAEAIDAFGMAEPERVQHGERKGRALEHGKLDRIERTPPALQQILARDFGALGFADRNHLRFGGF